jgi:phytoene dehydrogenase-like protein
MKRLDKMEPSCSGFVLLLGVEGEYPELAHHNIFFSSDYPGEFEQIFRDGVPPDDPTIYVAITSKTDTGHAPTGCENWFVLVNAPAADGRFDWDANKNEYADLVLRRLRVNRSFLPTFAEAFRAGGQKQESRKFEKGVRDRSPNGPQ